MAVLGYVRVSTEEQAEGTSLAEQRRQIAGLAMTAGLDDLEVLEDAGESGAVPVFSRPAGARLAAAGRGDVVILARLDRLSRDAADALAVIREWERRGARLIINGWGDVLGEDGTAGVGRIMVEIMAVFAGHERRVLRQRQREGQQAKRRAGGHVGGAPPFGWRKVGAGRAARLEPDPAQQDAVPTMRRLAAGGASLRAIAAAVRDRHGVRVSAPTVRAVLARAEPATAADNAPAVAA